MSDINPQDFLTEALSTPPEGTEQAPPPPPPSPAPAATGGYSPLIAAKRKELQELERKIETHRDTGVYLYKGSNGQDQFDNLLFQEDNVKVNRLSRELNDLQRKQDEHARLAEQRKGQALQAARQILQRELANVKEEQRKVITEGFARVYQSVPDGEWAKSMYADRRVLDAAIEQLLDTALGRLRRDAWKGNAPSGLGDDDFAAPAEKKPEEEVDGFTNNLLYALESQRKSMSVADMRRAQAAKEGGNA
jgi:hypothetical protein